MIVASSQGGVNIEEVASATPDAIIKDPVDITTGVVCVCVCMCVYSYIVPLSLIQLDIASIF